MNSQILCGVVFVLMMITFFIGLLAAGSASAEDGNHKLWIAPIIAGVLIAFSGTHLDDLQEKEMQSEQEAEVAPITETLQQVADAQNSSYQSKGHYSPQLNLRFSQPQLNANPLIDQLQLQLSADQRKYFISYEDEQYLFTISGANGLTVDRSCNAEVSICQNKQWSDPDEAQR